MILSSGPYFIYESLTISELVKYGLLSLTTTYGLSPLYAGWIVLGELLKPKEIMGCVLVFTAVILAQIPGMKKGDTK